MKTKHSRHLIAATFLGALASMTPALRAQDHAATSPDNAPAGQDSEAEIAKKLQNPIASMISVPFQNNYDDGAGPNGDGSKYTLNFQPVIPFSLNEHWNLISRTIIPYVDQHDVIGTTSQSGLSDTTASLWLSPKEPYKGWIWGVGPVFQLPTATDDLLGQEKWGAGPTAILLKQQCGWTYGALLNHVWSFAGEDDREDVDRTFLQPFLSYTFKTHTTVSLNTETTYDWENEQWTVPINAAVSQLVKIGGHPVQFQLGGRYYAEKPDFGPEWGLRFTVTFVFPQS